MQTLHDRTVAELMEQLIETGPEGMAAAFTAMLNLAMRIECRRHVGAQAYERSPERSGYANGYKPKKTRHPCRHPDGVGAQKPRRRCAVLSAGARTGVALLVRDQSRTRKPTETA